jgi:hypothetical protein
MRQHQIRVAGVLLENGHILLGSAESEPHSSLVFVGQKFYSRGGAVSLSIMAVSSSNNYLLRSPLSEDL